MCIYTFVATHMAYGRREIIMAMVPDVWWIIFEYCKVIHPFRMEV